MPPLPSRALLPTFRRGIRALQTGLHTGIGPGQSPGRMTWNLPLNPTRLPPMWWFSELGWPVSRPPDACTTLAWTCGCSTSPVAWGGGVRPGGCGAGPLITAPPSSTGATRSCWPWRKPSRAHAGTGGRSGWAAAPLVHPDSFAPGGFRCAWPAGMTALAKHLGRDLQVDRQQHVEALAVEGERWGHDPRRGPRRGPGAGDGRARGAGPGPAGVPGRAAGPRAREDRAGVVLDRARPVAPGRLPRGAAGAGLRRAPPPRHPVLQQIVHDSAKRPGDGGGPVLVLHARPEWSTAWLERPLEEVAEAPSSPPDVVGPWAAAPEWSVPHRWRYARCPRASASLPPSGWRWRAVPSC